MKKKLEKFFKDPVRGFKGVKKSIDKLKTSPAPEPPVKAVKKPNIKKPEEVVMHISASSVLKAAIIVMGVIFLSNFVQQIGNILMVLFVSMLFAAALDPTVDSLEEHGVPRGVSVLGIYVIALFVTGFFVSQMIPLIASQLVGVALSLNDWVKEFDQLWIALENASIELDRDALITQLQGSLEGIASELQAFAGNAVQTIFRFFNGVVNFVIVLILTFYLTVDEKGVDRFFVSLFPSKHGAYIVSKLEIVKHKIGYWLRGQVILMFVMFLFTWIFYSIIGLEYALTLGMLAGLLELLPVVGPALAGVPAVLVAFNQAPLLALTVLIFILASQQLEGNLLVPFIMRRAVGLSPIIVILSMLIGFQTMGVLGAIIAVPVATLLSIFVMDYTSKKK